jgi:hypothetical protein
LKNSKNRDYENVNDNQYGSWRDAFFSHLPGSYNERGYYTYWWTSTEYSDSSGAWCRRIDYNFNQVTLMTMIKYYGLSVRCVRDYYREYPGSFPEQRKHNDHDNKSGYKKWVIGQVYQELIMILQMEFQFKRRYNEKLR